MLFLVNFVENIVELHVFSQKYSFKTCGSTMIYGRILLENTHCIKKFFMR